MSTILNPIVVDKLKHFNRRRRQLLLARGFAAGIVTLLLGLAAVGTIDWLWLISDNARWLLSGTVYVAVALIVWLTSLRQLFHSPPDRELASRVEQLQPELREKLLSAVELSTSDSDLKQKPLNDSPLFRQLLQTEVAQQMLPLRIGRLLPLRLITSWLLAASIVGILAFVLLVVPDQRFRQLATRALLPGANVARISRIKVEIVQPNPPSRIVAENETVAVIIQTSGGSVGSAYLETRTESEGAVRIDMSKVDDNEFAANISVKNEDIDYRIRAGDAVTQYFSIKSAPRPRVRVFEKTYEYPAYSELAAETFTETHGDLVVLEGTNVHLQLELDQDVRDAELVIETSKTGEVRSLPLTRSDGSTLKWEVDVPVTESAIYKVHLVAAESGFDNPYSPKYEIRPQPDLIPRTGFVDQLSTTLLLPSNDLLELKAMAEDDLPLEKLVQQVSVNGEDWITTDLEMSSTDDGAGRQVAANWEWDLQPLGLKKGDQVLTKLVATDRMGNLGESIPLRVVIASNDYDPDRHAAMEAKLKIFAQMQDLSVLFQQQRDSAVEVIERLSKSPTVEAINESDQNALVDIAFKQQELAGTLLDQIHEVQDILPAGADSQDLDLAGQVVARIQREHAAAPLALLARLKLHRNQAGFRNDLLKIQNHFDRIADDAKNLASHYQYLAAFNFVRALALDLADILQQQQFVVNGPTQSWERLRRQESLVLQQLETFEQLINDQLPYLPESTVNPSLELLNWSASQRNRLQDNMESEEYLAELQEASRVVLRELENRQRVDTLDSGLPGRLTTARKDFEQRSGDLYSILHKLATAAQQYDRWSNETRNASDSQTSQLAAENASRFGGEIELALNSDLQRFIDLRDLTRHRPDTDSQYAADLGLTHRAVTYRLKLGSTNLDEESQVANHLYVIAPAFRTLEAGHSFENTFKLVNHLLEMERWRAETLDAHIDHPRHWDLLEQRMESTSNQFAQAKLPDELIRKLNETRWSQSARDAGRKINERRWNRELMVGAAPDLLEIRNRMQEIREQLLPIMAEARAAIAEYAPTIPEMARQAAEQVRELEHETTNAADQLEQESKVATADSIRPLQQRQEQVNQQLEELFEALIEDANNQDLIEEDERERAIDADAALATIQPPATEMNEALRRASESGKQPEQVQELAQAAEQQERTAQALERVADHFERLDQGQDVAESRDMLRDAISQDGQLAELQNEFDRARELGQMLEQDAQSLMEQLEQELQQNPAMQEALSEISQNTLADAEDSLQFAARDEQNIQQSNERSDQIFQQRKTEAASELRQLGHEARVLANDVVSRATQSAREGKTTEAADQLEEARRELEELATQASSARDDQPLRELMQRIEDSKQNLRSATETIRDAEVKTTAGATEEIHDNDDARKAAQNRANARHQDFMRQQERSARDAINRANQEKRQAQNQVNQTRQRVKQANRQVEQAKRNANEHPDNSSLQRNVEQQEANLAVQEQALEFAEGQQRRAETKREEAEKSLDQLKRETQPELDASNPDTQLADVYAEKAIKVAEELNRRLDKLAEDTDFGDTLTPSRSQVANSEERQQDLKTDVQQIADDLARAARHESRLNNQIASKAVNQVGEQVQDITNNQVTEAQQQLGNAVDQAEQSESPTVASDDATSAQSALAESQQALNQQAESLAELNQALGSPAEADGQDGSNSGQQGQSQQSQNQQAQNQQGQNQQSANQPAGTAASSNAGQGFTPQEQQQGQQLARALDELDRLQAASESGASENASQTNSGQLPLSSLQQAIQQSRAALAASRSSRQQQTMQAFNEGSNQSDGIPPSTGPQRDFDLRSVNRREDRDWGKLRSQSAEDLSRGNSDSVSPEYRESVEAYFKVLAERAGKK